MGGDDRSPRGRDPVVEAGAGIDPEELAERWGLHRCTGCGTCLEQCPTLKLSHPEAVEEMRRLAEGDPDADVLRRCVSCHACDTFCPNDAHPYGRILLAWQERYQARGLPVRARYFLPGRRPNFRQDLPFDQAERRLHQAWASERPPARVVLYPGCNLLAVPRLAEGVLFEHLPVWGAWDQCCGEPFFRMGLLDQVASRAAELTAHFGRYDLEEVVFPCPACYRMFSQVLPEGFGARFSFRSRLFSDWLEDRLREGTFRLDRLEPRRVVVQDSCHGRVLGQGFMQQQRDLVQNLGLEVVGALPGAPVWSCCGIAAGCRAYSVVDIVAEAYRTLRALDRYGADEVVTYCTGCWLTFNLVLALTRPFAVRVTHLLELVREALGERFEAGRGARPFVMARGIARHALVRYFSRGRFWL